jgi:DNA helicase-2/ATP-dependent DNA helicase PcrA
VLAVTFTNKAAKEMLTRLAAMLPINVRGMWIGTFHGLCNRLLRAHHRDAGLPQGFQILDTSDQLAAVKRLLKRSTSTTRSSRRAAALHQRAARKRASARRRSKPGTTGRASCVELYAAYEAQCQREGVVDFAELMLRSLRAAARQRPLREHYQRRFRHILVDEFQDTNKLQYAWLKLFAGGGAASVCVGDDDQSIYAFRGADVGNMADFEREFQVANLIKLEQNYRSTATSSTRQRHHQEQQRAPGQEPAHRPGRGRAGPRVRGHAQRLRDEARWLLEEARLHRDGHARAEIALLYRSNAQSRVIESRCSTPACPTACMAACASSSAPRSSTRWPTCACSRTPTTTPASCAW